MDLVQSPGNSGPGSGSGGQANWCSNPVFRLLGYLPAISFAATLIAGLAMLSGIHESGAESPVTVVLAVAGDLLGPPPGWWWAF